MRFRKATYLGDPINIIRIFNAKEVDEICLLDISAAGGEAGPNLDLLERAASECFMPLAYGGGVRDLATARAVLQAGCEKVILNSAAFELPELVAQIADHAGSQSVVVSIDARRSVLGGYRVYTHGGRRRHAIDPASHARAMEHCGAGELLLTAIHCDGTMAGYDLELIRRVTESVEIPVIACGGAGSLDDLCRAVASGAAACGVGSFFVFHGPHRAVLINVPAPEDLARAVSITTYPTALPSPIL